MLSGSPVAAARIRGSLWLGLVGWLIYLFSYFFLFKIRGGEGRKEEYFAGVGESFADGLYPSCILAPLEFAADIPFCELSLGTLEGKVGDVGEEGSVQCKA